jgi:sigma-E factor negative regulatory protein RseB
MNVTAANRLLAAACLVWVGTALAGDAENPRDWLERMSTAMSQMSYQGTFVYIQGDELVTMRITHVAGEDGVRERLVSLSGSPREVLRDSSGVRWVLGDDQSVMQDRAFNRNFFPELPLDQQALAAQSYELRLGGSGRIAGQGARNLEIVPRDAFRYGYSLWLENHSGLLLRWELRDSSGTSLARLVFTDFRMGSEVDPAELEGDGALQRFRTVESRLPAVGPAGASPRWRPVQLPPGFELTAYRCLAGEDEDLFEHLVYSDGLAAVSVYVERDGDRSGLEQGLSRLGTTHAFSMASEGLLVTVVGDVPAATVRLIGNAVAPVAR